MCPVETGENMATLGYSAQIITILGANLPIPWTSLQDAKS